MKKKRHLLATILAGILLPIGALRADVICDKVRPLKPVQCVCGKLVDETGGPVSGATVKVVKDGTDLATVKTGVDGTFIFGQLGSGSYELNAHLGGFQTFRSPIVVANPSKKCRRTLVILLMTFYPDNCGSYVVRQ